MDYEVSDKTIHYQLSCTIIWFWLIKQGNLILPTSSSWWTFCSEFILLKVLRDQAHILFSSFKRTNKKSFKALTDTGKYKWWHDPPSQQQSAVSMLLQHVNCYICAQKINIIIIKVQHGWPRFKFRVCTAPEAFHLIYGVVPQGLLTFLGFLGNAEFSPWKRLPEFNELRKSQKSLGAFVTVSDNFWGGGLFGRKKICAIPIWVMKDQY